jgi:hypothetical protein
MPTHGPHQLPENVSTETKKKFVLFAWGWKKPRGETRPTALA